ncbi:MAG: hypothetical protein JW947_11125 [Sedimentisphaerales bacterium]|nr:hypothetical protein [Sedimentisphaerales bacterium]
MEKSEKFSNFFHFFLELFRGLKYHNTKEKMSKTEEAVAFSGLSKGFKEAFREENSREEESR